MRSAEPAPLELWLGEFCEKTGRGYRFRGSPRSGLSAFLDDRIDDHARLAALGHLEPRAYVGFMQALSRDVVRRILGPAEGADGHPLGVGGPFAFDWSAYRPSDTYSALDARAMSLLSAIAYQEPGADGSDPTAVGPGYDGLATGGFDLRFIGREAPTTQGVMAVRGRDALLCFRGAEGMLSYDFVRGLQMSSVEWHGHVVHGGFLSAWEEVRGDVTRAVTELGPGRRIVLSGHSLGGAMATYCALDLQQQGIDVASVYTFGSPRFFDPDAASWYTAGPLGARTWRFANANDPIIGFPPRAGFVYTHAGVPVRFDDVGCMAWAFGSIGDPDSPEGAVEDDVGVLDGIEEHDIDSYIKRVFINGRARPHPLGSVATLIDDCMSYSLLDWVITDAEARRGAALLDTLSAEDLRTVASLLHARSVPRLLANLSRHDRRTYATLVERLNALTGPPRPR